MIWPQAQLWPDEAGDKININPHIPPSLTLAVLDVSI